MRAELQTVLASVRELTPEQLPELLGELETIRATAMMRLSQPVAVAQPDGLIDVVTAAQRLNVSEDYLYRHHENYPFTRRQGRKLLFSSRGIDQYISRKR